VGTIRHTDESIKFLIDARKDAKKARDFTKADRIRDDLKSQGVILEDRPSRGTTGAGMTREPPYTLDILRLAASLPVRDELEGADGTGEARSPACGSTLRTMVRMDGGRIARDRAEGHRLRLRPGQRGAGAGLGPRPPAAEVIVMRAAVKAWLDGRGEVPQGFAVLGPVQGRAGRHWRGAAAVRRAAEGAGDARMTVVPAQAGTPVREVD
jgi:hypothetical protein